MALPLDIKKRIAIALKEKARQQQLGLASAPVSNTPPVNLAPPPVTNGLSMPKAPSVPGATTPVPIFNAGDKMYNPGFMHIKKKLKPI